MKKILLAATFLAGALASANAADLGTRKPSPVLPIMATYNWTGFYVGIQGGYGFGDNTHTNGVVTSGKINNNGGMIGGTIGYNHQINSMVLGLEADIAYASFKDSTLTNCAAPGCKTEVRWFGTGRARLGYAIDRFMPYITGGVAFGDVRASAGAFVGTSTRTGWTIGGGVEAAVLQNVTLKAEYLYYDLGRFTYSSAANLSTTTKGHIVRAGVNYKF